MKSIENMCKRQAGSIWVQPVVDQYPNVELSSNGGTQMEVSIVMGVPQARQGWFMLGKIHL